MASPFIYTLTSFSGADLVVNFGKEVIGELQQISWAIQREKAPVFTLGSADPRSFSRGKRGIAGSMVFAVFDTDALMECMYRQWSDIAPKAMFTAAGNISVAGTENFTNALDLTSWNTAKSDADMSVAANTVGAAFGLSGTTQIDNKATVPSSNDSLTKDGNPNPFLKGDWRQGDSLINVPAGFSVIRGQNVVYADTLPPFDVTMTFANEYGQAAFQKIYDAEILNEGSGVSVDTIVMERQMTYVARRISPLIKGVYSRNSEGTLIPVGRDQNKPGSTVAANTNKGKVY